MKHASPAVTVAACLLLGCGASPQGNVLDVGPPSGSTSAAGSGSASARSATGGPAAAIVWKEDAAARLGITSLLVDDTGAVIAERAEPIVVIDGALLALREVPAQVGMCDCTVCPGPGPCAKANGTVPATLLNPTLVPLKGGGEDLPLAKMPIGPTCADAIVEYSRGFRPTSLIGPYLFGLVDDILVECAGTRPVYDTTPVALDLRTQKTLDTHPPPGRLGALTAAARAQLDNDGCTLDPKETPELFRGVAKLGPEGDVMAQYDFTKSAAYVCGMGPGHYTSDVGIDERGAPAFTAGAVVPKWLVPAIQSAHAIGFGASVTGTAAVDAAKHELWQAPLPPPPAAPE
ncbi:MAG: hypothetical protein U0414_08410 [Polyangiaceae bacterium]